MRVKIAELKTHLSKYVQSVRDGNEPIEVCVREQTVAYLTRAPSSPDIESPEQVLCKERLARKGVRITSRGIVTRKVLTPGNPQDGRNVGNSVLAIREEKEW